MARRANNGIGHNSNAEPLTEDETAALIAYYGLKIRSQRRIADEAKAAYDIERTEVNSLFALMKGDLKFSRKDFEDLLAKQDMSTAEFRHDENKRQTRYRLGGLAVGEQIDMFAGDTVDEQNEAQANGFRAGARGDDPTPPKTVNPMFLTNWQKGWSEGQADMMSKLDFAAKVIETRKPKPVELQADEPEGEGEDEGDPEVIKAKAKKLRDSGWTEPTPEEAAFN